MNTKRTLLFAPALLSLTNLIYEPSIGFAQGTAFTYQGRLESGSAPVDGNVDLTFALFNDPSAGSQAGTTQTNLNVAVSNGVFVATVDFGAGIFDGTAYWLAIGVRSNGAAVAFTPVSPRQPVTPSPYALYATVAPLANNSVTSAKIVDGTIATADLADNSVSSAKIVDGTIATVDLSNNAVTSTKIADGTIIGADLANNTVTSTQLADDIDLGTTNVSGRLDVFRTSANTAAISLIGSSSQISTYGSDGLEQIRLWGSTYGEILLHDSTTNNNTSVTLTANGSGGGLLNLSQGGTSSFGARLLGDSLGGGRLLAYSSSNSTTIDLRAQYDSATPAAWAGIYDNGSERVALAARNGSSGRGGLIDVKNNSSLNTVRLIGDSGTGDGVFEMYAGGTNLSFKILADDSSSGSAIYLYDGQGSQRIEIDSDDGDDAAVIRLRNASGDTTITLDASVAGDGRITTQELQITGGSDLSEQFDITPANEAPKPGMVVSIDPKNPGQLIPSTRAYDRTVAGVISGAGGVKPGMLMGQKGTKADGQHPVALSGRVFALADTCNGPIEPGDLMTTSNTAGHAMKATDATQSHGAILGKAMTSLSSGRGLVLVLVSLQ